jgi:hypothetical protein
MRSARRVIARKGRRILPERSRLTIPKVVADLRRSRQVLTDIEGQLDGLLCKLRQPQPRIDAGSADQLEGSLAQASQALAALDSLRQLW